MTDHIKLARALLGVSDKTALVDLAQTLIRHGVELIATGGTKAALEAASIPVTAVEQFTGHPEILGGRVKTLHPKVHGGILARRALAGDRDDLRKHEIVPIDLVCVNLYPFERAARKEGISTDELLEEIDIGGVALLRAAAKSWRDVVVVPSPERYEAVLAALGAGREVKDELRARLAV